MSAYAFSDTERAARRLQYLADIFSPDHTELLSADPAQGRPRRIYKNRNVKLGPLGLRQHIPIFVHPPRALCWGGELLLEYGGENGGSI